MIPIEDWKEIEPFIAKDCELYQLMDRLTTKKSVFEMTNEEFGEYLKPVVEQARRRAHELGMPNIYKNEDCQKNEEFIREYADGKKELVRLDSATRSFTALKTF